MHKSLDALDLLPIILATYESLHLFTRIAGNANKARSQKELVSVRDSATNGTNSGELCTSLVWMNDSYT